MYHCISRKRHNLSNFLSCQVLELAADVLKRVPEEIDYEQTAKIMSDDPSPLNVVLLQEVRLQW